ncbi:ATP-binding protein [Actinoplanes solisilvae]|uniref:ATP-binding protein n=1 Tax=Actinoplanes solisilvae TaxID=2486853 RepID=UPI000FDA13B5|nr:LuxR family transcriptional regulator [Actinoplanes solisilvae]
MRGRQREKDTLGRLLRDVREGHSRVLVLRGEAGIGKTALLDHLTGHGLTAGLRVVRVAGVEPEAEISYSALQHLCVPLLPHLDDLPPAQRSALSTAFGLSAGNPPELLPLGMAVLGLFAEAAAARPLLCVVDDVQWLDRQSALILTFVARRLSAESVAMVLSARSPGDEQILGGLPELRLDGLPEADARALLDSVLTGPVDSRVRDRIVAETRGNPLALLELPRGLSAAELAFGFGGYGAAPLTGRVEDGFRRRIETLPDPTRTLLLTAAVEPVGDVLLLWRALGTLGVGPEAAAPAEQEGLLEMGARVRFRHPLVRSATWRCADAAELSRVHAALADAIDPAVDPDRHAWHRAHATLGPDEDVASELEQSAGRALSRGGRSAAAAFLERSAALTPDPGARAGRALAAAGARLRAGSPALVPDLLAAAELGPLDELQRADAARLRATAAFVLNPGQDCVAPLLAAAGALAGLDGRAARETYLATLGAALHAGRLAGPGDLRHIAEAARALPSGSEPAGRMLAALSSWALDGYVPSVPHLARALNAISSDDDLDMAWSVTMTAIEVYDDRTWHRISGWAVRFAREAGALSLLPGALSYRAGALVFEGRFTEADELLDEAVASGQVAGLAGTHLSTGMILAAHRGREKEARERIEAAEREARPRGIGRLLGIAAYTRAVLGNGLGRYDEALAAARQATKHRDLGVYSWALSETVEAAARSGLPAVAAEAGERLRERTSAAGTPWALGAQAFADALVGLQPEENYRAAIKHLGEGHVGLLQARARLCFGEWLRRENRRAEARGELRVAYDTLSAMGAEAFAERAGRELLATGETVRKRATANPEELTAQEAQIAQLAERGRTNAEIAAELYLSPRTVEWHLRKIFAKLGIASRRELRL